MSYVIKSYPNNPTVNKILIAAQYGGLKVEYPADFKFGVDNKTEEFFKLNPAGQVPIIVGPEGAIFESNAAARYIARKGDRALLGSNDYDASLIDSFLELHRSSERSFGLLVSPLFGFSKFTPEKHQEGLEGSAKALSTLERWFTDGDKEWLVGGRVTLADIVWFVALYNLYSNAFGAEERAKYPHVLKWLHRAASQPQFQVYYPEVKLPDVGKKAPGQE